jgi:hypothetical protein
MKKDPKVNQELIGTRNVGFYILNQKENKAGDTYVIGFNPESVQFVTWFYNTECGGYSWGHYVFNLDSAMDDFNKRLAEH